MIPVYKPFLPKKSLVYAQQALEDGWLTNHNFNTIVEERLADMLGVNHVLLTCNGTAAMHLVAKGLKFKHPEIDKIIVPNIVYVAAWNAFLFDNEYELVMVGTDCDTWNFDTNKVYELLGDSNRNDVAVLAVHNLGNPVDVPGLFGNTNVQVVEDACEALFGQYHEKPIPSGGLVSALSFFGNKTITSGEGGAVVTNDDEIALYLKKLRGQGQGDRRYVHDVLGYNYRMTNIQAGVLLGQLDCMNEILDMKYRIWKRYEDAFSDRDDIILQKSTHGVKKSHWMFGISIPSKTQSFEIKHSFFASRGIDIRPMFYTMNTHKYINRKKIYMCDDPMGNFLSKNIIILPSYPELSGEDQNKIINAVNEFTKGKE